jgi:hypothetical protein
VTTYYISFQKRQSFRRTIRVEFAVRASTRQEARQVADREAARLRGYRFQGID